MTATKAYATHSTYTEGIYTCRSAGLLSLGDTRTSRTASPPSVFRTYVSPHAVCTELFVSWLSSHIKQEARLPQR